MQFLLCNLSIRGRIKISETFDLPSLLIYADQSYLLRKHPTNLSCQLSPGWSEVRLFISHYVLKANQILRKEGDYQCVAEVSGVRLSNRQVVKTTLVSDPLKLRRARITKFDQTTNHYVHVKQGQVARLPCAGLPDVVPGPAEICFIKNDMESDGCLSDKVDSIYLSTTTGMQISVVQPHHAGEYYCVVRNEYTKQTRKSPRYVKLRVDKAGNGTLLGIHNPPQLLFPSKENRPDNPIIVDVVAGQDVILECVFVDAKVGDETPQISLTDDEARLRQIWGNLRIRQVSQNDSGIYACHGLSPFDDSPSLQEDDHPKVYYSLIVHAPTDVHLEMNQNVRDKSWQLSCLVKNVRYEIPMVYVNGTTLIDAIAQMGVALSTNFYSNPINATIRIRSNYSGSVQCISRPAMDEAEIYGSGLERGRSHNLYVVSSPSRDHLIKQGPINVTATIGDDVELICLVIQRVNSKYWLKDGSYVPFGAARTQRVGSNSLKIYKVEKKDEGWYTCVVVGEGSEKSEQQAYLNVIDRTTAPPFLVTTEFHTNKKANKLLLMLNIFQKAASVTMEDVRGFVTGPHVRIQWSVIGKMEALTSIAGFKIELQTKTSNGSWIEADSVDSHVRATTIKDLVPNNAYVKGKAKFYLGNGVKSSKINYLRYQFRVKLIKDDGSSLISNSTNWMTVYLPTESSLPTEPKFKITSTILLTPTSVKLAWMHKATISNAKPRNFIVTYGMVNSRSSHIHHVNGNETEVIIDGLQANQTYEFSITAENQAGKGPSSPKVIIDMTKFQNDEGFLWFFSRIVKEGFFVHGLLLALSGLILTLFILLICCVVFYSIRGSNKKNQLFKSVSGKFLDTSYRIFNEQKVHKSRISENAINLYGFDFVDERLPLKVNQDEDSSACQKKFHFSDVLQNFHGRDDNTSDSNCEDNIHGQTCGIAICELRANQYHSCNHSDTSHRMLFPPTVDSVVASLQERQEITQISSSQRLFGSKCSNSLFSSSFGTSSLTDTSSGLISTQLACDSPSNLMTDISPQAAAYGDISRNTQVLSTDILSKVPIQTSKSSFTTFHNTDPCS
ncbi:immunoglobulin domain protein [Dictyocaulus viviparus]|uniref:Immunoglobulin domain protein n=1 Tax=Dictyocaulus viviparus TaxID=29172 RepID=A0A0D8XR22_DICVI|nr:immunoglobulin domain protein [Dictyocaulus viviparus]